MEPCASPDPACPGPAPDPAPVPAGRPSLPLHRFQRRQGRAGRRDGTVEWEYACNHPQDCWALANGNFLFCHSGGAIELTRASKIVWEYKAGPDTEVHACQPLPEGRVLVVECGPSRLIEVDRAGHIAKEIKLTPPPATVSRHDQFRGVRKTKDGRYLVCARASMRSRNSTRTAGSSGNPRARRRA